MKSLLIVSLVLIVGCATTEQFIKLDLGMSKAQVIETIGEPTLARGSIQNKFGQRIEVWEYTRLVGGWSPDKKTMWVYFADGRLCQWGQAGDWAREADRINEIRFR